jgi:hypothetical protein
MQADTRMKGVASQHHCTPHSCRCSQKKADQTDFTQNSINLQLHTNDCNHPANNPRKTKPDVAVCNDQQMALRALWHIGFTPSTAAHPTFAANAGFTHHPCCLQLPPSSCRQSCCCLLCHLSIITVNQVLQQLPPHRLRIRVLQSTSSNKGSLS